MKFFNTDNIKFKNLAPDIKFEIQEKLYAAEKNIAHIRLTIVVLNILVYLLFMEAYKSIPWLANTVIFSALAYSIFVVLFHPYRKYPLLLTSYFTSGTDAVLITCWIIGTGGFQSPFYVLWYVSILAIALRYTMRVTMRIAVIYSLLYLAIVILDTNIFNCLADVVVRMAYLLLIAVLGGLLSKETIDQIQAKLIIKKSEGEIKKREAELQEAHYKLEERVKERTKDLDESNNELLRINEDLDNFVYAVSHDLKSPILNVEALINIALDEIEGEDKKDLKDKILKSLDRVKASIQNLSEVAKNQKEIYDDLQTVKFEDILKEVIADNEEIIKNVNVKIDYNFDSIKTLSCSKKCLKSIISNFVSNAIKYRSPERNAHINIWSEDSDNYFILNVKDNGLGIDLHKNGAQLFTIFKRFHTHVEGTGIGLYMVKRLVERNKGKIKVESEPGKGTTFSIYFDKLNCGITL